MSIIVFTLLGYLSGSVLYARVFAKMLGKGDIFEKSRDKNPGATNAFEYGGFRCGCLTLIFDILKGFLPVAMYMDSCLRIGDPAVGLSFVLAAPVIGHIFPCWYHFRGGKGIAVTFGCLLGLWPYWQPVGILIVFFVFFSTVLRINPHYHRTLVTYFCTLAGMACLLSSSRVLAGFALITAAVSYRMLTSREEKEKMEVKLLWRH